MIPLAFITSWRAAAPWPDDYQVEQDLVLSRALVDIFSSDAGTKLALRGGTALNKLIVEEPVRYSEDIDLVQLTPEPIGDVFNYIRSRLDSYLGTPRRSFSDINATLKYRFDSEALPTVPLRLKIEINTREHDPYGSLEEYSFAVENPWCRSEGRIKTYSIEELLATKTRALYQRMKGRDLFDIWYILNNKTVNLNKVIIIFKHYMKAEGVLPGFDVFAGNIREKLTRDIFLADTNNLLRKSVTYNPFEACDYVLTAMSGAGYD